MHLISPCVCFPVNQLPLPKWYHVYGNKVIIVLVIYPPSSVIRIMLLRRKNFMKILMKKVSNMRQLQLAFSMQLNKRRILTILYFFVNSIISKYDQNKLFKHVSKLQQIINLTHQRCIKKTPFGLLFGTEMN